MLFRSKEKKYTELAGAILVMSIVGGAVIPAVQGLASDLFNSLQLSFLVPMGCFIFVGIYFFGKGQKINEVNSDEMHKMAQ